MLNTSIALTIYIAKLIIPWNGIMLGKVHFMKGYVIIRYLVIIFFLFPKSLLSCLWNSQLLSKHPFPYGWNRCIWIMRALKVTKNKVHLNLFTILARWWSNWFFWNVLMPSISHSFLYLSQLFIISYSFFMWIFVNLICHSSHWR